MTLSANPSPRELGQALRALRESKKVQLEEISEHSKIALRLLSALEEGNLGVLPGGIFPRLFVRQYVEFLKEDPNPWVRGFDAAARRLESESHPFEAVEERTPVVRRRIVPWAVGLLLVAVAVAALLLSYQRLGGERDSGSPPTPEAVLSALTPAPAPTATQPAPAAEGGTEQAAASPTAAPPPPPAQPTRADALVVRALVRPCWVEVLREGSPRSSQLIPAGGSWEVSGGGGDLEVVLGDAGAADVFYLGQHYGRLGGDGEVAHVRVGPHYPPPSPRGP